MLFILAIYFLYNKLSENKEQFISALSCVKTSSFILGLLFIFLLQFLNWFVEAKKFNQFLDSKINITFLTCVKAVYVGNFTSFFTPNRIGTFIGRILVLKQDKLLVTAITGLGNLAQLITTLFFMIVALFLYFIKDSNFIIFNNNYIYIIQFTYFLLLLIVVLIYIKPSIAIKRFSKINFIKKYANRLLILDDISFINKIKVLIFSIIRYLIFALQYYILFIAFNINISITELFIFLGLLYGVVTFIPSPFLGNLGTREAIALLFSSISGLGVIVPLISLLVWFINVGISSLIGGVIFSVSLKSPKC